MKETSFYGLGAFSKKVLVCFFEAAKKKHVTILWTWGTAYKNDRFFNKQAEERYKPFLNFLKKQNIIVLDSYTEHLYPEIFYTNTYNHLSEAGKHIRTEKIIRLLRPYLAPDIYSKKSHDIFLLDPKIHFINQDEIFHDTDLEYRILGDQDYDDLILSWDHINKILKNNKEKIFFSGNTLKQKAIVNNFALNTVGCETRSLAGDIDRFKNHIFLILYKNINMLEHGETNALPEPFSKVLQGTGYRSIIIGTGKYSKINLAIIHSAIARLSLKKKDKIESYKLPFSINMISTGFDIEPLRQCKLTIDGASFLDDNMKPGLAVLVIDPEIGVVVDNFLYENLRAQDSYCIYQLAGTSSTYETRLLSKDDFIMTGRSKSELNSEGNRVDVHFTEKNSTFGYPLSSDPAKKGILVMNVCKRSKGIVRAGIKTNVPEFFRTYPASQILDSSEEWQEVIIAFELYPKTWFKKQDWALVGIWVSDTDAQVQVKDMRIIWQQ